MCFIAIDKPSFLGVALGNRVQQDTWTAVHAVIDTWGKRCSQMIMFGNVPDIKVDSIPFLAVKDDHAGSWKAFAQVLTQVIIHLIVTQILWWLSLSILVNTSAKLMLKGMVRSLEIENILLNIYLLLH